NQRALGNEAALLDRHVDDAAADLERQVNGVDRIDAANEMARGISIIAADLVQAHRAWFDRGVVVAIAAAARQQQGERDQGGKGNPAVASLGWRQVLVTLAQAGDGRIELTHLSRSSASCCKCW